MKNRCRFESKQYQASSMGILTSPHHLPELQAVMVSYADFHQVRTRRHRAMEEGLHVSLDIPKYVKIYLDNGAFRFSRAGGEVPRQDYEAFVEQDTT